MELVSGAASGGFSVPVIDLVGQFFRGNWLERGGRVRESGAGVELWAKRGLFVWISNGGRVMDGKAVKFFSTIRGIEEQGSQQRMVYYGFSLSFDGDMADEEAYGRHMAALGEEIKGLVTRLEDMGLAVGDIFEVYQVFDAQVADRSHTFVRIPTVSDRGVG